MKNSWLIGVLVVGVVVAVLVVFNYQGRNQSVPLNEIFPEEEVRPVDINYEFVDNAQQPVEALPPMPSAGRTTSAKTAASPTSVTKSESAPKATASSSSKTFAIQVASFQDKAKAEQSLQGVKAKGYDAYLITRDLGEKGTWYRVYVGKYDTKAQAQENLAQVQKDYHGSFIIGPK
ncbi:MAG: SPOR domain-containing protein [Candidatus Omnitrophota bacterium]|jgi:cell division septation protein DedD|nr:SPOR domain-containing protein [Candidatus Omnitrophota bacterium]